MDRDIIDFLIAIARLVIKPEKGSLINQIGSGNGENEMKFVKLQNADKSVLDKEAVSYIRQRAIESSKEAESYSTSKVNEERERNSLFQKARTAIYLSSMN
jgi:hypothetical protein